jgi:hypothetical protein
MNLKYKIWDKPNKKWVNTPYCVNQYGDLQVKDVIFNNMDDFKIVLCADKNDMTRTTEYPKGKPIYEGHILKDDSNTYVVRFGEYQANDNHIYNNEVAYGFYIEYISHPGVIDHATRIEYGTIIGHELENPELLKKR